MVDFDYSVIDGNSAERKIRGENLGLDGNNIQIIGHKFRNDDIGSVGDTAATDQTGSSTVIAILKGMLRELLSIETNTQSSGGGSSSSAFSEDQQLDTTVVTSETVIATIDCRGKSRLGITIQNTGPNALNSFRTKIRTNSNFAFHFPEFTSTADYGANTADQTGNATAVIRKTNGDPTTLANGGFVWMRLNVESIESIEFDATVASGSTDIDAWWVIE